MNAASPSASSSATCPRVRASASVRASAASRSSSRPRRRASGSSGPRSQTMSAAVRSASVAVMGRHYPAVRRGRRGRSRPATQPATDLYSLWCMTSARAVKPERSKKFFASRAPGSAKASMPMQPSRRAERDDQIGDRLAHPHRPRLRLDEQIADHSEPGAVTQRLDLDRAEPDDRAVDRAHDDRRIVAPEQRGERLLERLGPGFARRPQRPAALLAHLGAQRARQSTSTGRSDGSAARAGSTGRLAGELFDLAENRAALPVCRLVRVDRLELVGAQPDEALHDLRRRQRVVARDRQVRAARSVVVAEWTTVGLARPDVDLGRGHGARGRRGGAAGASAGAAPVAGGRGRRRGRRRARATPRRRRRSDEPRRPSARRRASATVRSTRSRTIGGPNAIATCPRLRAVVTRCCTSSWRRSISARPRATNMSTNCGAVSFKNKPTPIGAYSSNSSVRSIRSGFSVMAVRSILARRPIVATSVPVIFELDRRGLGLGCRSLGTSSGGADERRRGRSRRRLGDRQTHPRGPLAVAHVRRFAAGGLDRGLDDGPVEQRVRSCTTPSASMTAVIPEIAACTTGRPVSAARIWPIATCWAELADRR